MLITASARTLAGAFALAAALEPQATPPRTGQAPPPATGIIVGRVVDVGTGDPIPDAIVGPATFLSSSISRFREPLASTDAQGRFLLRDLAKGSFMIRATAAGSLPGAAGQQRPTGPFQNIELDEGGRVGNVVIKLFKYCTASGTVVDEAGEPVVDVSVKAYRYAFVGGHRRLYSSYSGVNEDRGVEGTTDDRGMFRMTSLVPGDYVFAIVSAASTVPVAAMGDDVLSEGGRDLRTSLTLTRHPL